MQAQWLSTNEELVVVFGFNAELVRRLPFPYNMPYGGKNEMMSMVTSIAELFSLYSSDAQACADQRGVNERFFPGMGLHQDLQTFVRSKHPQDVAEIQAAFLHGGDVQRNLRLQRARILTNPTSWKVFGEQAESGSLIILGQRRDYVPFSFKPLNL